MDYQHHPDSVKLYTNEVTVASVANPTITACDMVSNCLTISPQDAADQVPTSLPVDEEPGGESVTTLFLPIISNQVNEQAEVKQSIASSSAQDRSPPTTVEMTHQIMLPLVMNQ